MLLLATFALNACSGSGSGGPTPVEVGGVAVPVQPGGDISFEFTLVDPQSKPADVTVEYSLDAGLTWNTATIEQGATTALASSPSGVRHTLVWDSVTDIGFRSTGPVLLRIVPSDAQGTGTERTAAMAVVNVGPAADRIEAHMIHFGPFDADKIAAAEQHDLVTLDPCDPSVTRAVIAEIQDGVDAADPRDDVLVIGYMNIGEDDRTIGISDTDLLADSRFVGDGSGPRVDPRGPDADGTSLVGLDPLGAPSNATGYASFYLDDKSVDVDGFGDGKPDRNDVTGACYANAGDPAWYDTLHSMTCAGVDAKPGIREMLTTDFGNGYGCDGLFLDNIDTCAPNSYTGPGDPDQAEFEWTAPGVAAFIALLRADYPDKVIVQNRGLFFFQPGVPQYEFTTREAIDFMKFESYRLDLDPSREFDAFFFADNKHNFVPKLQAEAYRKDGFQILSLGYAEGPGIEHDTLLGLSTVGFDTLVTDITEAQELAGYRHYLMDGAGQIVNTFVREQADFSDTTAPVWTSTYNVNNPGWPTPPSAPVARIGIQEAVPSFQAVRVRWDVALDLNPVSYVLYYDDKNIGFVGDQPDGATRVALDPEVGDGYTDGAGQSVYPYQATVGGLKKSKTYWFLVRAVDSNGNEDDNRVLLSATTFASDIAITIDGDFVDWKDVARAYKDKLDAKRSTGADWREIKVFNDTDNLYVYFESAHAFELDGGTPEELSPTRIHIDVDDDPFSGYRLGTIGSELMVAGDELHEQAEDVLDAGLLQSVDVNPTTSVADCELAIPLSRIDDAFGGRASKLRLTFHNADHPDFAPDQGYIEYTILR